MVVAVVMVVLVVVDTVDNTKKLILLGAAAALGLGLYVKKKQEAAAVEASPPVTHQPPSTPAPRPEPTPERHERPLPGIFPFNFAATPHADPFTGERVLADDPFPRQTPDVVVQYILNKIVVELSANDLLTPEEREELYQEILDQYYQELLEIARLNDYRLKPLTGVARAKYSSLILIISNHNDVFLNPQERAKHRVQMFSPLPHVKGTLQVARVAFAS